MVLRITDSNAARILSNVAGKVRIERHPGEAGRDRQISRSTDGRHRLSPIGKHYLNSLYILLCIYHPFLNCGLVILFRASVYFESAIWAEISNMSGAVKRAANVKNCDKMFHTCVSNALFTAKR